MFYTVCSGKWREFAFQSRTKQFFWTRVGPIGFLKFSLCSNFKPEANRAHSSPEKLLCSRLKSFWSLFATNSIEITRTLSSLMEFLILDFDGYSIVLPLGAILNYWFLMFAFSYPVAFNMISLPNILEPEGVRDEGQGNDYFANSF